MIEASEHHAAMSRWWNKRMDFSTVQWQDEASGRPGLKVSRCLEYSNAQSWQRQGEDTAWNGGAGRPTGEMMRRFHFLGLALPADEELGR